MRRACAGMTEMGAGAALVKGGHSVGSSSATDVFYDGKEFEAIALPWIESDNTHGTGCTLASCIAAELAKGRSMLDAVKIAKKYVYGAIETAPGLGSGHGPLNHLNS